MLGPVKEGDLLTVQQASAILPVGRAMLYRLVKEGQVRSIRVASVGSRRGRILIFRSALDDYVRRQEAAAPSPIKRSAVSVDDLRERLCRTSRRTDTGVGSD